MTNDFVEIEDITITDIKQEIDHHCTYLLLKTYLKEHPENYDCNFIQNLYNTIKEHYEGQNTWLEKIMEDKNYRNFYISLKNSGKY